MNRKRVRAGLEGLDGYSHLFVLGYFHKLRADQIGPLQVRPKRLVNRGFKLEELPVLGVFALDSPTRPNPIGLTLVQFVGRQGRLEWNSDPGHQRLPAGVQSARI